jgi:GNAT superfamily N-acetyltransferase
MMEKQTLSCVSPDRERLSGIRTLYEASFPADERRHFDDVIRLMETEPAFRADIYTEGDDMMGFILYWRFPSFLYAEHFAMRETVRGKGYGRTVFRDFLAQADRPVVLEVECPEDEISRRRIRFYERLGLVRSSRPYLQPPYSPDRHPVVLSLMSYGHIDLEERFDEVRNVLYSNVYGVRDIDIQRV